jgi:hypothetical protein
LGYDDIVIGSGLSAIGVVLGLAPHRRILVISGPRTGFLQLYGQRHPVPCAYLGHGGLGNYWHGVIPTGGCNNFADVTIDDFAEVFQRFYPGIDIRPHVRRPFLFVPWKPIRPATVWSQILAERPQTTMVHETASHFVARPKGVEVATEQKRHEGGRVWLCAGTLHTPALLDRSLDQRVSRDTVSDHVLCYVGQIDRGQYPEVKPSAVMRTRHGIWIEVRYDSEGIGLFMLKPARFGFRRLDWGIERRAVFGLPTGSAVSKIMRSASVGLIAEAVYNKFGIFPNASVQSVYAQVLVPDALRLHHDARLEMREQVIHEATNAARAACPWAAQMRHSRRPKIFIPMIHLHHSVDREALKRSGVNVPDASVQVADASIHDQIGPEHHSFKLIVAAFVKARDSQ